MNGRKAKQIKKLSITFVVDWLKSMLIEEERKKVSVKNYEKFLPKDTHFFSNGRLMVSAYTPRWFNKKIKKVMRHKDLKDITYLDVS